MEGSDRGTGTGMDMNFVFKYMCLITYVSLLLGVIDCADTEQVRERERERGADSLCCTKGNLRERWNKQERGRLWRETPNPRCTQFGNTARCHGNAALPQSQSPHAEAKTAVGKKRKQQEHIPSLKPSAEPGERLGEVRGRKVYKEDRCRQGSGGRGLKERTCVKIQ